MRTRFNIGKIRFSEKNFIMTGCTGEDGKPIEDKIVLQKINTEESSINFDKDGCERSVVYCDRTSNDRVLGIENIYCPVRGCDKNSCPLIDKVLETTESQMTQEPPAGRTLKLLREAEGCPDISSYFENDPMLLALAEVYSYNDSGKVVPFTDEAVSERQVYIYKKAPKDSTVERAVTNLHMLRALKGY